MNNRVVVKVLQEDVFVISVYSMNVWRRELQKKKNRSNLWKPSLRKKFEIKLKAQEEYQKEINNLHEEAESLRALNGENRQKLLKEFEAKSTLAAELEIEVQKLKSTAAEATKNKEDTELKCQHQIADMVALMEKHKEKLQKELADFKKEMSSMKTTPLSEARNKQAPGLNCTQGESSETPRESSSTRHIFDFTKTRRTPSSSNKEGSSALMRKAKILSNNTKDRGRQHTFTYKCLLDRESVVAFIITQTDLDFPLKELPNEDLKTPRSTTNRLGGTSKIKSYRIRTPPSSEKASGWGKSTLVLSDKSDSSDQLDLLPLLVHIYQMFPLYTASSTSSKDPKPRLSEITRELLEVSSNEKDARCWLDGCYGLNVSPEVLYSFGEEENSFVLTFDYQSCRNSVLNEGTGDGIEIGLLLGLLERCRISGGHHKVLQKSRKGGRVDEKGGRVDEKGGRVDEKGGE
ncbi:hypothetical protein F7725_004979 [Dissostichus mawsoni]|uniref:Uncharacterized protein n=1 Tax=Dissostichus mawsoni TaxID=36200 RepID=A0A7J5XK97_DISMA|nr:hypothetical protein F7725_004979 [Dissostichus mawsoni]